ncbi:MAG: 4Fe-4S binding protein [Sphaerochaetaceae bacterium]|nr:4Fe-4S binding protein [Sphaerochaetaceae bacterium]
MFNIFKKKEPIDKSQYLLSINSSACPQSHACPAVQVCPANALSQRGKKAPRVDLNKCVKCGKCVRYCSYRAIKLVPKSELFSKHKKK